MAEEQATHQTPERAAAADMLGRVKAIHAQIQQSAAGNGGSSTDPRLAAILSQLTAVESRLALALESPGGLTIDLAAIAALIGASEAAATNALQTIAAETARTAQEVVTTSAATRREVETLSHDLYGRRIFDPFLRFTSEDEEAEYRAREEQRQRAILAQLAHHTPQGDLMAGGIAAGQLLDAHAHGAGASPEFQTRWDSLFSKLQKHRQAMLAAGQSVEEFDAYIRTQVRLVLRKDGLSDAEIDACLAAVSSPLEAAQLYLSSHQEAPRQKSRVAPAAMPQSAPGLGIQIVTVDDNQPQKPTGPIDFAAMTAKLQAAGVQMEGEAPAPASGHGLTVGEPPATVVIRTPL